MAEQRHCPQCGKELPSDAPGGLCPECLLEQGREHEPGQVPTTASPPSGGFVAPEPEALAEKFPNLEVLDLLGTGGMGAVYKARQPQLNRLVAVKILPPELGNDPAFEERFSREAQALAQLNHPNIVGVHDFGQTDSQYYLVMEYVDGANIRQLIQQGGLKPEESLAIVPQICEALQFAHDEGIVHRDIKPENILIDKRGRVKIADFGLAKLIHPELAGETPEARYPEVSLTGTGQVMGTLHYMAPEQMKGSHAVDHRADIYSLGVVFYEMLTGELPLGKFEPPSKKVHVDVRLDEVVLRSLENEPQRRYQMASEVKTDVEPTSSRRPADSVTPKGETDITPSQSTSHLNQIFGFWMTPQPGFGRWVGLPMLILLGLWAAGLAIELAPGTTLLPVNEAAGIWLAIGFAIFPLCFLFLTLVWAMVGRRRNVQVGRRIKAQPRRQGSDRYEDGPDSQGRELQGLVGRADEFVRSAVGGSPAAASSARAIPESVRRQLRGPAIGLMAISIVECVMLITGIVFIISILGAALVHQYPPPRQSPSAAPSVETRI